MHNLRNTISMTQVAEQLLATDSRKIEKKLQKIRKVVIKQQEER